MQNGTNMTNVIDTYPKLELDAFSSWVVDRTPIFMYNSSKQTMVRAEITL